jgi:hypothetical protein
LGGGGAQRSRSFHPSEAANGGMDENSPA